MAVRHDQTFAPDDLDRDFTEQDFARASADERRVREGFWRKLGASAARIPFAEEVTSAYYCALDRKTPLRVRALLFGALAYFLLPTDAMPDLMPALGFTDDAAVLATALNLLAGHISPAHRAAAQAALSRLRTRRS